MHGALQYAMWPLQECATLVEHLLFEQFSSVLFGGNECILHPLADPFAQLYAAQYTILYV